MGFKRRTYDQYGFRGDELNDRAGSFYAFPLIDGSYGACQVIWESKALVELVVLRWRGDTRPSSEDLVGCKVLARHCVTGPVPKRFVLVGSGPCVAEYTTDHRAFGLWDGIPLTTHSSWRRSQVPGPLVDQFYVALSRQDMVSLPLFGGRTIDVRANLSILRIGTDSDDAVHLQPGEKVDWSALDALGGLSELHYHGPDDDMLAYVATRPLIERVHWSAHGRHEIEIDLANRGLTAATIELNDHPLEIITDDRLYMLHIHGDCESHLAIRHPEAGARLSLGFSGMKNQPASLRGLQHLSGYSVSKPGSISVAELLCHPNLETVEFDLSDGSIADIEHLGSLRKLRSINIRNCYQFDVDKFPHADTWPGLDTISIHGMRKSHATILRRSLASTPELRLSGAQSDAALAKGALNPFVDWREEDKRVGRSACRAFRDAFDAIDRLSDTASEGEVRAVLNAFVDHMNQLHASHGFDTSWRETVGEAYSQLSQFAPQSIRPSMNASWSRFEATRDF